jgi:phenylacetate-coenzyme A ligase PaaK-like adenylate-forming protein
MRAPLGGEDACAAVRTITIGPDRGAAFPHERPRNPEVRPALGATVVLLPQFETRRYIEAIERFGCTWLTAVPPMLAMMFRESALLDSTDVSGVTAIRMGSAPVSERLRAQIKQTFPNAGVLNVYGTTEAGPVVFGPDPAGRSPTPPLVGRNPVWS